MDGRRSNPPDAQASSSQSTSTPMRSSQAPNTNDSAEVEAFLRQAGVLRSSEPSHAQAHPSQIAGSRTRSSSHHSTSQHATPHVPPPPFTEFTWSSTASAPYNIFNSQPGAYPSSPGLVGDVPPISGQQMTFTAGGDFGAAASNTGSPAGGMSFGAAADPSEAEQADVVEDKRRRNTAASARFRIKKKQKTQNLERTVSDLTGRADELEKEAADLRKENGWLREIVMLKGRRHYEQMQSGGAPAPAIPQSSENNDNESSSEEEESQQEASHGDSSRKLTGKGKGKGKRK